MMKSLIRGMIDKSQVIDDCLGVMDSFRGKVEKIAQMKKRVKQGDKACIEVLKQRKEIDETLDSMASERLLMEATLQELNKINHCEFTLELVK